MKLAIFATIVIHFTSSTYLHVPTSIAAFSNTAKIVRAGAAAVDVASSVGISPALGGGDKDVGQQVFQMNCASCHANGKNVSMREKTLEKDALDQYLTGGRNEEAVVTLVTYGERAMPAFRRRFGEDDIQNVTAYTITTSEKGWDID